MARLHRQPSSRQRIDLSKRSRPGRKQNRAAPTTPTRTGQSFFGSLAVFCALASLFFMGVEGLVKLLESQGSTELGQLLKPYLVPAQLVAALAGFALAVFSFGLSAKRQRSAVIGLLLNLGLMIGWVALRVWLR